jgi:uncharacterized protein with GYD domain
MPLYMIQYSYTPEAWNAMLSGQAQRDRQRAVEELVARLGGKFPKLVFEDDYPPPIRCKKFAFGEHDVVALIYFPSNREAAAFAMLISATGSVKSFRTTPLMTIEEGIDAMQLAQDMTKTVPYSPPFRSKP